MYDLKNDISYLVRKVIFKVFNVPGPGLFESVYIRALCLRWINPGYQ
jgi:hypothetical protein